MSGLRPPNPSFHLLRSPRTPLPLTSASDPVPSSHSNTRLRLQLRGLVPHCSSLPKSSSSVRSLPPSLLLCSGAPSVPRPSSYPFLPPLRHICSVHLDAKRRQVDSLHINYEFALSLTSVTTSQLKLPFIVPRFAFSCTYILYMYTICSSA